MKHTDTRTQTVSHEETTSITCDMCGAELLKGDFCRQGAFFKTDFGYGSRHDLERWEFDLCDSCCDWLRGHIDVAVTDETWVP